MFLDELQESVSQESWVFEASLKEVCPIMLVGEEALVNDFRSCSTGVRYVRGSLVHVALDSPGISFPDVLHYAGTLLRARLLLVLQPVQRHGDASQWLPVAHFVLVLRLRPVSQLALRSGASGGDESRIRGLVISLLTDRGDDEAEVG